MSEARGIKWDDSKIMGLLPPQVAMEVISPRRHVDIGARTPVDQESYCGPCLGPQLQPPLSTICSQPGRTYSRPTEVTSDKGIMLSGLSLHS